MKKGRSHALRIGRYSQSGQIYYLIFTTQKREPIFSNPLAARQAVLALRQLSPSADTIAFVVMPDHIHWLMHLKDSYSLSETVKLFKKLCTRALKQSIWQTGFYDHAVRSEESIIDIARYIVMNPVRAGLCRSVRNYPWWDCIYL
ncbi:transposase [uncultured Neptuniibacter sp.]|uniref:REP-associated tyrosine transposase n=1 Tax=uncultured Neptuniibacter sp. TaxID=502143 RepID=UPI00260F530D|nr:transposase [uncultured Neptuniibacter sp.]